MTSVDETVLAVGDRNVPVCATREAVLAMRRAVSYSVGVL
jgi:hypothetical protein